MPCENIKTGYFANFSEQSASFRVLVLIISKWLGKKAGIFPADASVLDLSFIKSIYGFGSVLLELSLGYHA